MTATTRWKDQPEIINGSELLAEWFTSPFSYAVYKREGRYYLTTGNLFGSQTVSSKDPDAIFILINKVYEAGDRNVKIDLPMGVELMEIKS